MSMHTIFVVIRPTSPEPVLTGIALTLDPTDALRELTLWFPPGEVYACRISDTAAKEVRDALEVARDMPRGKPPTSALTLLKRYSQSMQKVADIT